MVYTVNKCMYVVQSTVQVGEGLEVDEKQEDEGLGVSGSVISRNERAEGPEEGGK